MLFFAGNVVHNDVTVNRIFPFNPVCSLQMSYTDFQLFFIWRRSENYLAKAIIFENAVNVIAVNVIFARL